MKIAAFNVKQLGWRKVNNAFVRENLIKIVSRYSVVVMLEVIDANGRAMDKFLRALNDHEDNIQHPYEMKCSEPLGRNSYKEKFVFFYREDQVRMINSYQYEEEEEEEEEDEEDDDDEYEDEDEAVDKLAREPFILQFKSPNTAVKKLALIPVHTKPEDAERELDAVDDVVKAVRERWRTNNIMILGDFNADGRYLSKKRLKRSRISSAPYHWLIDDDADTTTSKSNDHTYDRIVVFGQTMLKAVKQKSAKPFNFQRAFRLTDKEAQSISNHYPVEVELKPHTSATRRTSGTREGSIQSQAHEETTSLFSVTPWISSAFPPSSQHIYHHPRLQLPAFIPRPSHRYTPYHFIPKPSHRSTPYYFTPRRFLPLPSSPDTLSDLSTLLSM